MLQVLRLRARQLVDEPVGAVRSGTVRRRGGQMGPRERIVECAGRPTGPRQSGGRSVRFRVVRLSRLATTGSRKGGKEDWERGRLGRPRRQGSGPIAKRRIVGENPSHDPEHPPQSTSSPAAAVVAAPRTGCVR